MKAGANEINQQVVTIMQGRSQVI